MIEQLSNSFRDYVFTEENHSYVDVTTGIPLKSVTTFLKEVSPKFNEAYWLPYKTFQRNNLDVKFIDETVFMVNGERFRPHIDNIESYDLEVTAEDIKYEWSLLAKIGTSRGSYLHDYIENLWHRKIRKESSPDILNKLSAIEAIKYIKSIEILKKLANDFYNDLSNSRSVVTTEFVVGDKKIGISGTFDALLFNKDKGVYELWDYKTDKKMRETGREIIRYFNIPYSEINKYSLQLGIYKYILEKNTDIKIDGLYIAHFDYKSNVQQTIEANDYSELIKEFFNGDNFATYFKHSGFNKRA